MATQYAFGKIVTDGLVLCLDAADRNSYVSGSTTWNSVVGSNNITLVNGPTFNSANGGSIVFDGVNDYSTGSVVMTTSFSVNFWFKPLQVKDYSPIFGVGDWGNFIWHTTAVGSIYCGTDISSRFNPSTPGCGNGSIVVGTIYNYTYTYLSGTGSLYKNGTLVATATNHAIPVSGGIALPYTVATQSGSYGSVNVNSYNFQLYNRALTASEVLQNYNAQKSRFGL
jgi:hypothetical protein